MDRLPLAPDYDHQPIGALLHHLRGLDAVRLRELRAYEAEHAARHGVLMMIDARLDQLADAEAGGAQRGVTPTAPRPRTPQPGPSPAPHRSGRVEQAP